MKLSDISVQTGYPYKGNGEQQVERFCSLQNPQKNAIAFLKNKKQLTDEVASKIPVLILPTELEKDFSGNCLLAPDPYLAFAQVSKLLSPDLPAKGFIHPTAVVSDDVQLGNNVSIGANCIIEPGAVISADSVIQAGCYIGSNVHLGDACYLFPKVTINANCVLGKQVRIQSGAVIGSEGFGYAREESGSWNRIAQSGRVVIGNRVEIGANTTIDRGAIDDTVIEDGVILDNQIQIAHNVRIGQNTAMAGCVGVAGSAIIGKNCTVGGAAVILGHLSIVDNVHITALSLVSNSIKKPGHYSSGGLLEETQSWRKNAIRFKQLDQLFRRVKKGISVKKEE